MEIYRCWSSVVSCFMAKKFYDPWRVACLLICLTALLIFATKECREDVVTLEDIAMGQQPASVRSIKDDNETSGLAGHQDIRTSWHRAGKTRQSGIVLDLWSSLILVPPELTLLLSLSLILGLTPLSAAAIWSTPLCPLCPDIVTNNFIDGLCLVFNCPASCLSCLNAARDNCSFYDAFIKSVSRLLVVSSSYSPSSSSSSSLLALPLSCCVWQLTLAPSHLWSCLSLSLSVTVTRHLFARLAMTVVDCNFPAHFLFVVSRFSLSNMFRKLLGTVESCLTKLIGKR